MQAQLDIARLKAALTRRRSDRDFQGAGGRDPRMVGCSGSFLPTRWKNSAASSPRSIARCAQKQAERDKIDGDDRQDRRDLPVEAARRIRKTLYEQDYGSKLDSLTIEQDLVEHQQELEVQKGRLAEAEAAIAALASNAGRPRTSIADYP